MVPSSASFFSLCRQESHFSKLGGMSLCWGCGLRSHSISHYLSGRETWVARCCASMKKVTIMQGLPGNKGKTYPNPSPS